MGIKALAVILVLVGAVVAFSGCTESTYLVTFDGRPAINLQLNEDISTVPGNTEIRYHNIGLKKEAEQGLNVSFVWESPEGIYCSTIVDGEEVEQLHLEPGDIITIANRYQYDSYLKSGQYHTTFSLVPCG